MKFIEDFKKFIFKGNVIDMAVGVVIGGQFGKIVTGLVNYIINPFVGLFIKSGNLDSFKTVISEAVVDEAGTVVTPENAILWGTWIQTIIDFLITALCIFVVLRVMMKAKNKLEYKKIAEEKKKAEEAEAKAKAEKEAADAAAAAAAEKQALIEDSIIKQAELLCDIKSLLEKQ